MRLLKCCPSVVVPLQQLPLPQFNRGSGSDTLKRWRDRLELYGSFIVKPRGLDIKILAAAAFSSLQFGGGLGVRPGPPKYSNVLVMCAKRSVSDRNAAKAFSKPLRRAARFSTSLVINA